MKNKSKISKDFFITQDISIKAAMRQMDTNKEKILLVINKKKTFIGTIADGDIRRWILSNKSLNASIKNIYNKNPIYVKEDFDINKVKRLMINTKIEWIPVINKKKEVISVLFWDNVFRDKITLKEKINIPVIIMAGGEGARLKPFTHILPKPLIPIKGQPIIEIIMNKFNLYQIKSFYISINYKSLIMKAYFKEAKLNYNIKYIHEKQPLGTAGCLKQLKTKISSDIIVTNCDIIIDCDYSEIVNFHTKSNNDITIVGSFRHFTIPYGICDIANGGILKGIKERPQYDFLVSTGMYIINKKVLSLIPSNKKFDMPELIKKVKNKNGKVAVFPISEKSWLDIGQWEEYQKTVKEIGYAE